MRISDWSSDVCSSDLALFQNGKRADAAPWLEKAAMRGAPRAQLVYGTMLFNGDGGQAKDWVRAYALLTRASGSGLSQASETLANMDEYIPKYQRRSEAHTSELTSIMRISYAVFFVQKQSTKLVE